MFYLNSTDAGFTFIFLVCDVTPWNGRPGTAGDIFVTGFTFSHRRAGMATAALLAHPRT